MINLLAQSLILSNLTLLNSDQPTESRLQALKPFFTPPPSHQVTLDPKEERERKKLHTPHLLKGYILVSPPSGYCFTIKTRPRTKDFVVCKEKRIPFQLRDLQADGRISWTIKTGPNDFGTKVSWKTSYRIINKINLDMPWPGPSTDTVFKSCTFKKLPNGERELLIHLFHRQKWKIRLPKKDTLAVQLDYTPPNLYVQKVDAKNGLDSVAESSQKTAEEIRQDREAKKKHIKAPSSIATSWQMHPRESYSIPGRNVLFDISPAGESQGSCRYRYSGYRHEDTVAAFECHNVGQFKWLYMPLPCLKQAST